MTTRKKKETRLQAVRRANTLSRVAAAQDKRITELGWALDAAVGKWAKATEDSAHLSKVICYIAAKSGAPIEVDASLMEALPEGSKLSQVYDEERDVYIYACVRPKPAVEPPTIEEQAGLRLTS